MAALGLAFALAASAAPAGRHSDPYHRSVSGLEIQLEVARPGGGLSSNAGAPRKYYSLVSVSLRDGGTSAPVRGARVTAHVEEIGSRGTTKALEPLPAGGGARYGNYFLMPGIDTYWIAVTVRRRSVPAVHATFTYRSAH